LTTRPIILAHGIYGKSFLHAGVANYLPGLDDLLPYRRHCFRGLRGYLRDQGFRAHHVYLGFGESVEVRSRELKDQVLAVLELEGAEKVHILAHSMGGLDARHMVVDLGMSQCVASITTIGTPHLGTGLADFVTGGPGNRRGALLGSCSFLRGFADLTKTACAGFNARAEALEAANTVRYSTVTCQTKPCLAHCSLRITGSILAQLEGPNDGLVSVTSQAWTTQLRAPDGTSKPVDQFQFPMDGDHINERGWWNTSRSNGPRSLAQFSREKRTFEAKVRAAYLEMAERMRDE